MPKARPKARPQAAAPPEAPLIAEILAAAQQERKGPAKWTSMLPPETLAEITQVRERYRAGEINRTKSALSRAICAALTSRGLINVTWREVLRWFNESR